MLPRRPWKWGYSRIETKGNEGGTVIGTFDSLSTKLIGWCLVFLEGSNPWLVEIPLANMTVWWCDFCIRIPLGSSNKILCGKTTALVGGFKYFSFSPLAGEMIQFDEHIVQLVWFNHQLELVLKTRVFPLDLNLID